MKAIKFGTDGWRAVIAQDFTFDTLAQVSTGVLKSLQKAKPEYRKIVVGYDRRFLSKEFAQHVCCVLAKKGYHALLTDTFVPTPAVSWCAKHYDEVAGAIMITASHNPPQYNGFKFKETFGGSALLATTQAFEKEIAALKPDEIPLIDAHDFQRFVDDQAIELISPMPQYIAALKAQVDTQVISKHGFRVGLDVMNGSAAHWFKQVLEAVGVEVEHINEEDNPSFRGMAPEPKAENLAELSQLVTSKLLNCGFASDGDADRLGAIDENGNYFTTQMILSSVYWHMLENRKKAWSISRSASTTKMVDLLAEKYGHHCIETPVGFKFIAEQIVTGHAQIGGEESGGIGIIDHLPERDGFLTALLLLEMMAVTGRTLVQTYQFLCNTIRPYQFVRLDLKVPKETMQKAMKALGENAPNEWMGRKVEKLSTVDGYKFYNEDGSWLLIRPSGTEPLFRLYAETESITASNDMVLAAKRFVENC